VLFDPCCDRQNVGIEDDVFRWEPHLMDQQVIGPLADSDFVILVGSLTFLVKCHHNRCGSVLSNQFGATEKLWFAIFQ
jgi:hypothetical protein